MKRTIVAPLTGAILLALAGTAQAAATRTTTFNVSATVVDNCVISAGDLSLGVFDGTTDLASTSTITVNCSNGTDYTVDLSPARRAPTRTARCSAPRARSRSCTTCTRPAITARSGVTA